MAQTVNEIIQLAFESAQIVRVGQDMNDVHVNYGLRVLNEMLGRWQDDEIQHGLGDEVSVTTQVYSGALSSAIRKNLAVELLNGPYNGKLTPLFVTEAMKEKNNLNSYEGEMSYDTALLNRSTTFDIESGSA